MIWKITHPAKPAPGMVMTHARITSRATPHRTDVNRLVAPTPITAEVITWVDETGIAYP